MLRIIRPFTFAIPLRVKVFIKSIFVNPILYKDEFLIASYGELNSDDTILIISGHNAGLYSIIHNVIGYLIYAEQKGYIPVIDYKNIKTYYHDNSFDGNLWEEYFYQTSIISLNEAYSSKNIVHTPLSFSYGQYPSNFLHLISDTDKTLQIHKIFEKYIKYNDITKSYIDKMYSNFEGMVLLGVYIRGTDYKNAPGHAKQPELDNIFKQIDYFLTKYVEIEGIFVSTEEKETLDAIISKYGMLVHYQNRPLIKGYKTGLITPKIFFEDNLNKYKRGMEYLADIEILSRLDYFLCGLSNGSAAVIEKNGLRFKEHLVLFEGYND